MPRRMQAASAFLRRRGGNVLYAHDAGYLKIRHYGNQRLGAKSTLQRASVNLPDGSHQIPGRRTLEDVGAGPFRQGTVGIGTRFKSGQDDDACFWKFCPNCDHGVDAAPIRKPEVHESDIGLVFTKTLDRLASAAGLRHHQHPRLGVDDHGNPLAHKGMIVNTAYPNSCSHILHFIAPTQPVGCNRNHLVFVTFTR
jgi:hypothetical protein